MRKNRFVPFFIWGEYPDIATFTLPYFPFEMSQVKSDYCEIVAQSKSRCVILHQLTVETSLLAPSEQYDVYEYAMLVTDKKWNVSVSKPIAYTEPQHVSIP